MTRNPAAAAIGSWLPIEQVAARLYGPQNRETIDAAYKRARRFIAAADLPLTRLGRRLYVRDQDLSRFLDGGGAA